MPDYNYKCDTEFVIQQTQFIIKYKLLMLFIVYLYYMYKHQNLNEYTRFTENTTTMSNITTSCLTKLY